MSTSTYGQELATRLFEVIDGQRWDDYETVCHSDVTMTSPFGVIHGAAAWAEFSKGFAAAMPDGKHHVAEVIEDGQRVVVRGIWTGTHLGPLVSPQGEVPPTGIAVELPFCAVSTIRSGRLAEVQVYLDQLTMLAQLKLIPAPAAA
jgi:predicted ester cyclase